MTARSARFILRDATADWHARVDALFSHADLTDRDSYGRFLSAQAAAHLPVERALEDGGIGDLLADWSDRRRAALIRADLAALGFPLPSPEATPLLAGVPALLGAAYVLEGSRLGGALLARSVAPGLPASFLSAARPAAWRDMVATLDARLRTREDIDAAISAACDVFALFERGGRRMLKV